MAVLQEGVQVTVVDSTGTEVSDPVTHTLKTSGGGGGGGGAVTVADGADVAEGATTDSAVTGDNPGTVNAHLRGLTKNLDVALSTRTKPADQQHTIIDSGTTVVTQPTGTNLHVVTDATSTTAVTGNVTVTNAGLTNIDVALSTRTKPADQQHAIIDSGTTTVTQATAANLNALVAQGAGAATTAPWPHNNGTVASTSAAWTSATALDTTLSIAVTGYGTVIFSNTVTGTVASATINFEGSDDGGTTWRSQIAVRQDSATISNTTASAVTSSTWMIGVTGLTNFRIRLNPAITNTGTATVRLQATAAAGSPHVNVGSINNTVPTNITTVGGTATVNGGLAGSLAVGGTQANGAAITANPVIVGGTDGTNAARLIMNSAANQSAATGNGAALVEFGPRWRVTSTPAVSNQATASKSAGSAGVRHVCTGIIFSGGATTAVALTKLNVNLRDGGTGAGTILASWTVVCPATTGQVVPITSVMDLNIVGTAATAMTLEFSGLLTNLFEDVTIIGYDVS